MYSNTEVQILATICNELYNQQKILYIASIAIYIYIVICRCFYPKRLTIGEYKKQFVLNKQTDRASARSTKSQALFK